MHRERLARRGPIARCRDSGTAHAQVFGVHIFLDAMHRAIAAHARLLDATEWCHRRGTVEITPELMPTMPLRQVPLTRQTSREEKLAARLLKVGIARESTWQRHMALWGPHQPQSGPAQSQSAW